jgi:hypothetical protein
LASSEMLNNPEISNWRLQVWNIDKEYEN